MTQFPAYDQLSVLMRPGGIIPVNRALNFEAAPEWLVNLNKEFANLKSMCDSYKKALETIDVNCLINLMSAKPISRRAFMTLAEDIQEICGQALSEPKEPA